MSLIIGVDDMSLVHCVYRTRLPRYSLLRRYLSSASPAWILFFVLYDWTALLVCQSCLTIDGREVMLFGYASCLDMIELICL
jgi:hypothetical protein